MQSSSLHSKRKTLDRRSDIENLLIAKIDLERAFSELKFIDQIVLLYRFRDGEQLDKVADRLNRNQSVNTYNIKSVSQIESRAIAKIRERMEVKGK